MQENLTGKGCSPHALSWLLSWQLKGQHDAACLQSSEHSPSGTHTQGFRAAACAGVGVQAHLRAEAVGVQPLSRGSENGAAGCEVSGGSRQRPAAAAVQVCMQLAAPACCCYRLPLLQRSAAAAVRRQRANRLRFHIPAPTHQFVDCVAVGTRVAARARGAAAARELLVVVGAAHR